MGVSLSVIVLLVTCCVIAITLYVLNLLLCGASLVLARPDFTFLYSDLYVFSPRDYIISVEFTNAGSIGIVSFNVTLVNARGNIMLRVGPIRFERVLSPGVSVACRIQVNLTNTNSPVDVDCSIPVNKSIIEWSPRPPGQVTSSRSYRLVVQVRAVNGLVVSHTVSLFARG